MTGQGRERGRANRISACFLSAALCSSSGYASTAIAVVTPQGIVLGVDQKSVERCDSPCSSLEENKRIVFIGNRVAVGTAGLYMVVGNSHMVAPYSFQMLMGQVRTRLPLDAVVSVVAETIKEEAAKVLFWFDLYVRRGLVKQEDFPSDQPVEYLVAGYQNLVPTIYSVHVDVDWQQVRLRGTALTLMHPRPDETGRPRIYGVGSKRLLQQLTGRHGVLYRRLLSKVPFECQRLLDNKVLSVHQATKLVRAALEIEARANPAHVAPPFTIVTIPKIGAAQ